MGVSPAGDGGRQARGPDKRRDSLEPRMSRTWDESMLLGAPGLLADARLWLGRLQERLE